MKNVLIGAQVYSVRELAEADFVQTMKELKRFGYEGVELAGIYGMEPEKIKEILAQIQLIPISAHVPVDSLLEDMNKTLDIYQTIGCKYIVIPYLEEERRYGREEYQNTLDLMHQIATGCLVRGMKMLYHNHEFEFEKVPSGEYFLDQLYSQFTFDEMETELDTCWIKVAGEDPIAYLEKYKSHCPLVHMKDFSRKNGLELVALGDGEQDIKGIVKKAVDCGAKWLIIEQDDHPYNTPMENMERSIHFMKQN